MARYPRGFGASGVSIQASEKSDTVLMTQDFVSGRKRSEASAITMCGRLGSRRGQELQNADQVCCEEAILTDAFPITGCKKARPTVNRTSLGRIKWDSC